MEIVEVEILTQTITAQYGALAAGDILRTSPAFARHLVKEAYAAKYVNAADDVEPAAPEAPKVKPSEGLTIPELKAALEAKGIAVPENVTKKADLAALLDGAA